MYVSKTVETFSCSAESRSEASSVVASGVSVVASARACSTDCSARPIRSLPSSDLRKHRYLLWRMKFLNDGVVYINIRPRLYPVTISKSIPGYMLSICQIILKSVQWFRVIFNRSNFFVQVRFPEFV